MSTSLFLVTLELCTRSCVTGPMDAQQIDMLCWQSTNQQLRPMPQRCDNYLNMRLHVVGGESFESCNNDALVNGALNLSKKTTTLRRLEQVEETQNSF